MRRKKQWLSELEKCKDPVYFYEQYFRPKIPLTEQDKRILRELHKLQTTPLPVFYGKRRTHA